MTFWIAVIVVVLVVLALGLRYDRKHRRLNDSTGNTMGGLARSTKLDGQEKSSRWGAGM